MSFTGKRPDIMGRSDYIQRDLLCSMGYTTKHGLWVQIIHITPVIIRSSDKLPGNCTVTVSQSVYF